MKYDHKFLAEFTGTDQAGRGALLRWLGRQPEAVQIEAFRFAADLQYQHRPALKGRGAEGEFAILSLALKKMTDVERAPERRDSTPEEIAKTQDLRIQRLKADKKSKASRKARLIEIRFFEQIHNWQNQPDPLSWRDISKYLAKYHKVKISHDYLRRTYLEILKAKKDRGEI